VKRYENEVVFSSYVTSTMRRVTRGISNECFQILSCSSLGSSGNKVNCVIFLEAVVMSLSSRRRIDRRPETVAMKFISTSPSVYFFLVQKLGEGQTEWLYVNKARQQPKRKRGLQDSVVVNVLNHKCSFYGRFQDSNNTV